MIAEIECWLPVEAIKRLKEKGMLPGYSVSDKQWHPADVAVTIRIETRKPRKAELLAADEKKAVLAEEKKWQAITDERT